MKESMDNYIFNPRPVKQSDRTEKLYTVLGDHDFIDEDNNPRIKKSLNKTLAKSIESNGTIKYLIKIGQYGQIYNPMGMYSEGQNNKFLAKIGRNAWEFKEVNQQIFDMYINFLRTKNLAWLNNAERGLI